MSFKKLLGNYSKNGDFDSPDYYIHNGINTKDLMPGLGHWRGSAVGHIIRAGKKSGETEKQALENAVICLIRRIQELEE